MTVFDMPLGVTGVMLPELGAEAQFALCAELGIKRYSLRPRVVPPEAADRPFSNWGRHQWDLTPQKLAREAGHIRRQMLDAGVEPFGTVPAESCDASDDALKLNFEGAAAVGAGRVRVAAPGHPAGAFDYEELLQRTIDRFRQIVDLADPFHVKVVIETHTGCIASSPGLAWNIVRHFDPEAVGVIFDLPNFAIEGNLAPHVAVAVLKRWLDHVHIGGARRATGTHDPRGFRRMITQMCPLPESDLYIPGWIDALTSARLAPTLVIEDYTDGMPGATRLRQSVEALRRFA